MTRDAISLKDLLILRNQNRDEFWTKENKKGLLGTALGFRYKDEKLTDEPVVQVFVQDKTNRKWIDNTKIIPKEIKSSDGKLRCGIDIIESKEYPLDKNHYFKAYDKKGNEKHYYPFEIIEEPPLSTENFNILEILSGRSNKIYCGAQIYHEENGLGTLGFFAKDKTRNNKIGFVTNWHIAYSNKSINTISFPNKFGKEIGITKKSYLDMPANKRFPNIINNKDNKLHYDLDCAFVELSDNYTKDIETSLYNIGEIKPPIPLDINTMNPVNMEVISIGARRGMQKGKIFSFSYEHIKGFFADYLILGDEIIDKNGRTIIETAFSDSGDSGKLIVSRDNHNAVALHYGGSKKKLRKRKGIEKWSHAIDINIILEKLEVDILY